MTPLEGLGQRIAGFRGSRSQRDLATETGLDVSTISRIENGKVDPTYGTLEKIRIALGLDWEELVGDEPDRLRPDILVQTTDSSMMVVEFKMRRLGNDRAVAEKEAQQLGSFIESYASFRRAGASAMAMPVGPRPPYGFTEDLMTDDEAARFREIVKHIVLYDDELPIERQLADSAETANIDVPILEEMLDEGSRWIPESDILQNLASIRSSDDLISKPLLNYVNKRGPFSDVIAAWEKADEIWTRPAMPREGAVETVSALPAVLVEGQEDKAYLENLREQLASELREEIAAVNDRLGEALEILAERLPADEAERLRHGRSRRAS